MKVKGIGPGPTYNCNGIGDLSSCAVDWDCVEVYGPNWVCSSGKCAYKGNYSACDDGTPLGGCSPLQQRCMEGPTSFGSILVNNAPCCSNATCQTDADPGCYIDKTITSEEYVGSYFTIYRNVISGGNNFSQNELNDVVVYFIASKDDNTLSSYLYSRGSSSNEVIGAVLNKAGAVFGNKGTRVAGTSYCYNALDVNGQQCCVDNTVPQGLCYNNMACDSSAGLCKSTSGGNGGCYMTVDTSNNACCHDDTNWPGYCYTSKVCDSSSGLCKDSGGSQGCSMTTDVYGNPCCIDSTNSPGYCYPNKVCDTSTGFCKDSGGSTTTTVNVNQCTDGTPLGQCSTVNPGYSCTQYGGPPVLVWDLNCQGGGSGCYMTTDVNGASCCVDSTNTPGKCWTGKTCDTSTGLCKDSGGGTRCDQVCATSGYKYYNCDYSTCQSPFVPQSGSCAGLGSGSQCCCGNSGGGSSGCYMTTDVNTGQPCCVDATCALGKCWLNRNCNIYGSCTGGGGGNCDDNKKDVNGIRCCVDDTSTPGFCYKNRYCLATAGGRRCVNY